MRSDVKDESGKQYGKWLVCEYAGHGRWHVTCTCGHESTALGRTLRRGESTGCKSCAVTKSKTQHGAVGSTEYRIWIGIKSRCYDSNRKEFKNYGGRGITVCKEWRDSFGAFYNDMGPRPTGSYYSLDRIDNDGPYAPDNCRWATRAEQNANSRHAHLIEFKGEVMMLKDWAERLGITQQALCGRLKKYPVEIALTQAPRKNVPPGARFSTRSRWIEFNGERKILEDWAREIGITHAALHRRLKQHSVEVALTMSKNQRAKHKEGTK